MRSITHPLAVLGSIILFTGFAIAADTLPGGANALKEAYDNWSLNCGLQKADSGPQVVCAVSVEQVDTKTKRRALAVALNPNGDGSAKGSLLMPFGLALSKGVVIQVDAGPVTSPIAFRTCTPSGCIVPLDWTADSVKVAGNGTSLKIGATADNGQSVNLAVPLKGFAAAFNRALELTR